jgi:SulP family sulfate permease
MPTWLFASLRGYQLSWLPRDVVAGLMLAAIAIPGQLATARLAGMPPETGLYAFAAGSLAFAAFGANRFISVGADSTIAPIFAGGLAALSAAGSVDYAGLAGTLAILVGAVLVLVGLLRAGWLANLLSVPVTTGFLAGISVHIVVGELPALLGLPAEHGPLLARLIHIIGRIGEANPYPLAIGLAVLIVTLGAARISARLPGPLIALAGAGLAVPLFHLQDHGVLLLGPLSAHLPHFALPSIPGDSRLGSLLPLVLIIAMVCIMQTSAVARTFPSEPKTRENISRDFAGVGAGSILAGLFGAFPVDASPPSTAIVCESGGRSQIAAIAAVALTAAIAFLAAGLLAYVPYAALSGILFYLAFRIFRLDEMINIYRHGGRETLLILTSAALVVVLPIETGMLLAIILSFFHSLYIVARPPSAVLSRVPGGTIWWPASRQEKREHEPGVLVFSPAAPINFTNAAFICDAILARVAEAREPLRLLVIEGSGIIEIDYTGAQILQQTIADLRERGIEVALARLSDTRAQASARRTGLTAVLGEQRVFKSVEEAVRAIPHSPSRPLPGARGKKGQDA